MDKATIRCLAARMVAQGLRKASALTSEARREQHMAGLLPAKDGCTLMMSAEAKLKKAQRMEQICGRLAAAHNIGPKGTGRGLQPRPDRKTSTAVLKVKVAHA